MLSILTALGSRDLWKEIPSFWGFSVDETAASPLVELTKVDFMDMYRGYAQLRHKIPAVVMAHKAKGQRVLFFKGLVLKEKCHGSDEGRSDEDYYRVTKVGGGKRRTAYATRVEFQGAGQCTRFSQLAVVRNHVASLDDVKISEASVSSTRCCPSIYLAGRGNYKCELVPVECRDLTYL